MTEKPGLVLRKNEERRLEAGHLWVFSNEVDTARTPLTALAPGAQVPVWSSRGKFLCMAMVNPHSLICARVYSYQRAQPLDAQLLCERLQHALRLRDSQFPAPFYRLVNAEGDWLPGLVVDRYDRHLVVQIATAGMEALLDVIVEQLQQLLNPESIVLRNSVAVRELEQLPLYDKLAYGEATDTVQVIENDLRYQLSLQDGQKTGWFFDHRDSRHLLSTIARDCRVLDACCYLGAWGINALAGGASDVVAIDSSQVALDGAAANAALNGFGDHWSGVKGEVGAQLRALREAGERFDIIVLDPPAFIKRKKDKRGGVQKYRSINSLAVQLLRPGGLLVSCSCSHHLAAADLQNIVLQAGRDAHASVQLIARRGQGRDHPVHAAIPETDYLKAVFARFLV